ncbi:ankyrin repeat and LEM domain-containing protein 1-like [Coccinella septempunctata]|uniref:ankyrin repeat and LEM domain-containing protein 1-like n=1 Tax=Coccinella septempunctata TaxID=41139 RepID=UPI001D07F7FD|nr:ankyrin repeat and LEM domain-containing protein 1-like [Coccinella septempunctata]
MSIYRGKTPKEVFLATLLYDALDDENVSAINTFLAKGADFNLILPARGISAFHLVVGKESEEFSTKYTALLLQKGADPNIKTTDGLTGLHISAAYGRTKNLHLLLCCGGDPDVRDANYKKPIDYAEEYEHKECKNLLLSFMESQRLVFRSDIEPAFNLTLEKILVENGGHTGEYELVQEYKTEPLTQKNLASLYQLPETDTTEYVMKWCQNHLQSTTPPEKSQEFASRIEPSPTNSDFRESSNDESEWGKRSVEYNVVNDSIKFRKRYVKVRDKNSAKKDKKSATPAKNEKVEVDIAPVVKKTESIVNDVTNAAIFTTIKEFSAESGIVTLPNSKSEDFFSADNKESFCPVDAVVEVPTDTTQTVEVSMTNTEDYHTCSAGNDTTPINTTFVLDKNVFEITSDLSHLAVDDVKSRRSSTKSEGICSNDISFVSVSEVYKYIDEEEGIVLFEKRLLKTATSDYAGSIVSSSICSKLSSLPATADYDTDTLRKELTTHGYNPGPITFTTKRVYLRKLKQIRKHPPCQIISEPTRKVFSVELERTLRDPNWLKDASAYKTLEESVIKEFNTVNYARKWREGYSKTSFTYLLLDPRITNNLPCRAEVMDSKDMWEVFLSSIFYVGKGKRSRPYSHLYEAVGLWKDGKRTSPNKKLNLILDVWNSGSGVICLHIFQNVLPVEAYTREAAIISALKLENLTNIKGGEYYGISSTWPQKQKKLLGVYLLYKAMMIFLNEGERQLCPADIE